MSTRVWMKMFVAGTVMCIGGPALVWYVTPTEEELFKKYNPDLQKRSLENRQKRQEDFDNFVGMLKQYSHSDKTIWDAAAADQQAKAKAKAIQTDLAKQEVEAARPLSLAELEKAEANRATSSNSSSKG